MDCFGLKWLFNLFLLPTGLYLAAANYLFASEGEAMQINCSSNKVISWQLETKDVLVLCEGERPMINDKSRIYNRIDISSDCTILTINNFTKEDAVTYVCFIIQKGINNKDKYVQHKIHVKLRHFPIVQSTSITFRASSRPMTVECSVIGEPDVYNFSKWQHYTNNNELVRSLNGSKHGTLNLQNNVSMCPIYEDSGKYRCSVTNGIPDHFGNLWQTGIINLTIEGKHERAKPHQNNYIGHLYAEVSASIWITGIKERQNKKHCIPSLVETQFFGNPFNSTGFVCEFQIQNTTLKDFHNYTVEIENKCGKNTFEIALLLADLGKPEKPKVVVINSSSKYIFLQWQSGLDVGSNQFFFIQYRKRSSSAWEYLKVENSNNTNHSIYIRNLEPSTNYEIRMYACNAHGNSTYTNHIISTTNEKSNENQSYWTEFILVMVAIVPVCIIIIWWRLKKAKNRSHDNSYRANDDYIQEEGGAIENNLYQAANDIIQQPSVSSNREDDAYSSIDRRQQVVHEQNVTYQISNRGNKSIIDKKDNQYQQQSNMNNGWNHQNLNYVEVAFDNTVPNGTFCIHGADERTPYADIDFFARADPLIISLENEESLSSHSVENDDFVSLEEVQQWMISNE